MLPIVAEVAKNLGGVLLASRPQFDDMIDGLTFGIAAGTAYAAFETIVLYSSVFTSGDFRTTDGLASWAVVVVNLMVVKSLIYGTATGIAVAAFSGKGEGYDGFTGSYFLAFGLAVAANIGYWLGVRLLAYVPFGQALGLLWGFVILAVLVVRIRVMMQAALLEAAVEDAVRTDGERSKRATRRRQLLPGVREPAARQLQLLHGVRHLRPLQQPPGAAGHERAAPHPRREASHDRAASPGPGRPAAGRAAAPRSAAATGVRAGSRPDGPARLRLPAGRDTGRSRAHGAGRVAAGSSHRAAARRSG